MSNYSDYLQKLKLNDINVKNDEELIALYHELGPIYVKRFDIPIYDYKIIHTAFTRVYGELEHRGYKYKENGFVKGE